MSFQNNAQSASYSFHEFQMKSTKHTQSPLSPQAEITSPQQRGGAYGLGQALDNVSAVLGPVLAVMLMLWFTNDIRTVM
jgi:hypothetical protein